MNRMILVQLLAATLASAALAQSWTDVSTPLITAQGITPDYPGGCSGVIADRVNGGAIFNINGNGLWKSSNGVSGWTRIDNNTISGRGESGSAVQVDQNDPRRIAVFSLDGTAGYTLDGTYWTSFAGMGRGWDFGSIDWSSLTTPVMITAKHEDGGKVYKSTDGGQTWQLMNITVNAQSAPDKSMIGALGANIFIYCTGSGIQRSTDGGSTWQSVSSTSARCKVPVLFKGVHYLGTPTGLIKSTDKGATWQTQGTTRDIWQGPYFGADENTMVVADRTNLYKTINGGATWTKIATAPQTSKPIQYDTQWAGSFTWDPVGNAVFAADLWNTVVRLGLSTSSVGSLGARAPAACTSTVTRGVDGWVRTNSREQCSLAGKRISAAIAAQRAGLRRGIQ